MNLHRIICILLIFTLNVPVAVFAAETESPNIQAADNHYEKQLAMLQQLGAVSGELLRESLITRDRFIDILIKLIAKEAESEFMPFTDVTAKNNFRKSISIAYTMGLIKGDNNSNFRPNDYITINDAVIVLLRVLGYEQMFMLSNEEDFHAAAMKVAVQLGMLKGITGSGGEYCNANDYLQMLFNAFEIPVMKMSSISKEISTYQTDINQTLLSEYCDIYKTSDQLTETFVTSLYGKKNLPNEQVRIGNTVYKVGDTDVWKHIGEYIKIYYQQGEADELGTIVYYETTKKYDIITIDAEHINGFSDFRLSYYDEYSRNKNAEIYETASIVYNGKVLAENEFNEEIFVPDLGGVKLISTGNGNKYDIVIIESYSDCIVEGITDNEKGYVLYDYNENLNNISFDPQNPRLFLEITNEAGVRQTLSDIQANMIVSAAISNDGLAIKLITCKKRIYSMISEYGDDYLIAAEYDKEGHSVIGKKYKLSKAFAKSENKNKLVIGNSLNICLNAFGEVAYIDTHEDGKYYAYLTAMNYSKGIDCKLQFKAFLEKGTVGIYNVKDCFILDGYSVKVSEKDRITALFCQNDKFVPQIAVLTLDFDSAITEIDTITETDREDSDYLRELDGETPQTLEACNLGKKYSSSGMRFGNLFLDKSTKIMAIPLNDDALDRDYFIMNNTFAGSRYYYVRGYVREHDKETADVLIYYYSSNFKNSADDTIIYDGIDTGITIRSFPVIEYDLIYGTVSKISTTLDEEGQEVQKVEISTTGLRTEQLRLYPDVFTSKITTGMFVRYHAISGRINYIEPLIDLSKNSFENAPNVLKWVDGIPRYYSYHTMYNGQIMRFGSVASPPKQHINADIVYSGALLKRGAVLHYVPENLVESANYTDDTFYKINLSGATILKYDNVKKTLHKTDVMSIVSYEDSPQNFSRMLIGTQYTNLLFIIIV